MSNLIPLFLRANEIGDDGDMAPVTDATAYFFEEGSSTPLTVYEDAGLTTPRGTSVAADANGIFPLCYTDEPAVKLDIRDGEGTSLYNHPIDGYPTFANSDNAASSISATPQTGNAGTTVAAQLNNNTARGNTLENAAGLPTASGSMGSYAIASVYTISAYAVRQEFEFVANHTNVGGGSDTLNVDGVGAITLQKHEGSTTKADLEAGDITAGNKVRVKYDGSHFVVVSPLNAGEETKGLVEAATDAEMTAGTADKFGDAAKLKTLLDTRLHGYRSNNLLSADASSITITGLSDLSYVEFSCVGTKAESGSGSFTVEARTSAGTWRTLAEVGTVTQVGFIARGVIENFNNDEGTGIRPGQVLLGRRASGSLDRSESENQGTDGAAHATFAPAFDEVWDELRVSLSAGTFEGNTADAATELRVWGY